MFFISFLFHTIPCCARSPVFPILILRLMSLLLFFNKHLFYIFMFISRISNSSFIVSIMYIMQILFNSSGISFLCSANRFTRCLYTLDVLPSCSVPARPEPGYGHSFQMIFSDPERDRSLAGTV